MYCRVIVDIVHENVADPFTYHIPDNMSLMPLYHSQLYFESAAMIPALITVGKTLEALSKGRTTDALRSLLKLAPKTAVLWRDGQETELFDLLLLRRVYDPGALYGLGDYPLTLPAADGPAEFEAAAEAGRSLAADQIGKINEKLAELYLGVR